MKLRFAQLIFFFLLGQLTLNLKLTQSMQLLNYTKHSEEFLFPNNSSEAHSPVDYKNAFSLIANEAEIFLQTEMKELEHSLKAHKHHVMNRPKRSINVDTSSRTSPGKFQKQKLGMLQFNLTLVTELLNVEGITVEGLGLVRQSGAGQTYIVVAGQATIGQLNPAVQLPVLRLDGPKATIIQSVIVAGAIGVETFLIDGDPYFIFAINTGKDFVDPKIHRSKLYKINEDGSIGSVQTFLTVSSSKWKSFVVGGRTFLAQASYMKYAEQPRNSSECDGTKLIASKSVKIYGWIGKAFKQESSIRGSFVTDIEDCSIRGRHFLILANRQMNSTIGSNETYVYIYEVSGATEKAVIKFRLFQKLPASAPRSVHCFRSSGTLFLAVADEYRLESGKRFYNKESSIYRFNGLFFVRFERIAAFGGLEWTFMAVPSPNPLPLLRLRTLSFEQPIFACSDGRWLPFEMGSLYGVQHIVAVDDNHIVASMRNNDIVLLKWNVRSESDSLETCSRLNVQLKNVLMQRIRVEGELKELIDGLWMLEHDGKGVRSKVSGTSLTVLGQKLQRLEVEVTDLQRLLNMLKLHEQRNSALKHLVVDELVVGTLTTWSLDATKVSGVQFRLFVENAVKISPYTENRLAFGGARFSQLLSNAVVLKGPLNGSFFPRDFAVLSRENTFSALHSVETVVASNELNILGASLDGVDLSNVLLTSGNQVVRDKVVFEKGLVVRNLDVTSGNIDGIDWNWLTLEAVRLDRNTTVRGDKEFASGIEILRKLVVGGKLNGVDVVELEGQAITLSGPQAMDSSHISWNDVVFTKEVSVKTVNGNRFPEDFLLLGHITWNVEHLALPSMKARFLDVRGRINGLDLTKDVVTTHSRQLIYGKKVFSHAKISNVTLLTNDRRNPLHLTELKASAIRVLGRQYPDVLQLFGRLARTVDRDLVCHTLTFKSRVSFNGNVNMPSSVFDDLVSSRSDSPLVLSTLVMDTVEFWRDVVVAGRVDGVDIRHFVRNTLLTTGDQRVIGQLHFRDSFSAARVTGLEIVLGVDFSWARKRSFLKVQKELRLSRLHVDRLHVSDRFCGANLKDLLRDTVLLGTSRQITGKKTFHSSFTVDSIETKLNVGVDGKNFGFLAANAVYSDEDFVLGGHVHFDDSLSVSSLDVGVVDGVTMSSLFQESLFVDESRSLVVQNTLEARRVYVDSLNGLNIRRYFSEVLLTTTPRLSKYVTFDKVVVKQALVFTGTINSLRVEDFVHCNNKNVVVTAPKRFHGPVYVCGILDVAVKRLQYVPSLESVDRLIVDGTLDVLRSVDGIDLNGFLRDAVMMRPGERVVLKCALDFNQLDLDVVTELRGAFNGFHLGKLLSSMITIDTLQVIDTRLVFKDVTFRETLTATNVDVLDELEVSGRSLAWWTLHVPCNPNSPMIFTGSVTVFGDVNIDGAIDGVHFDDIAALNSPKAISVLEVGDLHVSGFVMGVNISEWSRRSADILSSNIIIGGSKRLDALVPIGKVVCSERTGLDVHGVLRTEASLPKCQGRDVPLTINSDVTIEMGRSNIDTSEIRSFALSPSSVSCASISQLYSALNGLSLQLEGYELKDFLRNRLLCRFHSGIPLQDDFVSVTLSCFGLKRYAVIVKSGESELVSFVLPEEIEGTVQMCHSFYEKRLLVVVLSVGSRSSSRILVWSSAFNRLVKIDGSLQDVTMFAHAHFSRVWLATASSVGNGRTGLAHVTVWNWSSAEHAFERLQSFKLPYAGVVARFVPSTADLIVSSFANDRSSLITVLSYFEARNEFVSMFSTIVAVDSSTMVACHHRRTTIIAFLNRIGNLVVVEFTGSSKPENHVFLVSPAASKLFCLPISQCPMLMVGDLHFATAYCYRGKSLVEVGTIPARQVSEMTSGETSKHTYFSIQTGPADNNEACNFGDLSVYQRLKYDYIVSACVPDCRSHVGVSYDHDSVVVQLRPEMAAMDRRCEEPWCDVGGFQTRFPPPKPAERRPWFAPPLIKVDYAPPVLRVTTQSRPTASSSESNIVAGFTDAISADKEEVVVETSTMIVKDSEDEDKASTRLFIEEDVKEIVEVSTEADGELGTEETALDASTQTFMETIADSKVGVSTEYIAEDEKVILDEASTVTLAVSPVEGIIEMSIETFSEDDEEILEASTVTHLETSMDDVIEASTEVISEGKMERIQEASTEPLQKPTAGNIVKVATEIVSEDNEISEASTEVLLETAVEDIVDVSTELISKADKEEILEASTEVVAESFVEEVVDASTGFISVDKKEEIEETSTETFMKTAVDDSVEMSTEIISKYYQDEREDVIEVSTAYIREDKDVLETSTEIHLEGIKVATELPVDSSIEDIIEASTDSISDEDKEEILETSTETLVDTAVEDVIEVSTESMSEEDKEEIVESSTETLVDTAVEDVIEASTESVSEVDKEEILETSMDTLIDTAVEDIIEVSTESIGEEDKEEIVVTSMETLVDTAVEDIIEASTDSISDEDKEEIVESSTETLVDTAVEDIIGVSTESISEDDKEEILDTSTETLVDTAVEDVIGVSTESISEDDKEEILETSMDTLVDTAVEDIIEVSTKSVSEEDKEETSMDTLIDTVDTAVEDIIEVSTGLISEEDKEDSLETSTETLVDIAVEDMIKVSTDSISEEDEEEIVETSTETLVDTAVEDIIEASTDSISKEDEKEIVVTSTETLVDIAVEDMIKLSTDSISEEDEEEILETSTETLVDTAVEDVIEVSTESIGDEDEEEIVETSTETLVDIAVEDMIKVSTESISEEDKEETSMDTLIDTVDTAVEDIIEVPTDSISKEDEEEIGDTSTETLVDTAVEDIVEVSTESISEEEEILETSTETLVDTAVEDVIEVSESIGDEDEEIVVTSMETLVDTAVEGIIRVSTESVSEVDKEEILETSMDTLIDTAVEDIIEVSTELIGEEDKEEIVVTSMETLVDTAVEDIIKASTDLIIEEDEEIMETSTETLVDTAVEDIMEMFTEGFSEAVTEQLLIRSTTPDKSEEVVDVSRREADEGITELTSDCHSESNKSEEIDGPTSTLKVKESSYSTATRRAYSSSTVPTFTVSGARAPKILSQTATSEGHVSEAVTEVFMSSPHDVRPSPVTAAGRTASSALVLPLVDLTKEPPCDDESGAATVFPIAELLPISSVEQMESDSDNFNTDSDGFTVTDLAVVEDEVVKTEFNSSVTTIDEDAVTESMEEFSTVILTTEDLKDETQKSSTETFVEIPGEGIIGMSTVRIGKYEKEELRQESTETSLEDIVELSTELVSEVDEIVIQESSTETFAQTAVEGIIKVSTDLFTEDVKEENLEISVEPPVEPSVEYVVETSTEYISIGKDEIRVEDIVETTSEHSELGSAFQVIGTTSADVIGMSAEDFVDGELEEIVSESSEVFSDRENAWELSVSATAGKTLAEDVATVSTDLSVETVVSETDILPTESMIEVSADDAVRVSTEAFIQSDKVETVDVSSQKSIDVDYEASTKYIVDDHSRYTAGTWSNRALGAFTETSVAFVEEDFMKASTEPVSETVTRDSLDVSSEKTTDEEAAVERTTDETPTDTRVMEYSTVEITKDEEVVAISAVSTDDILETDGEENLVFSTIDVIEHDGEISLDLSTVAITEDKFDTADISTEGFSEAVTEQLLRSTTPDKSEEVVDVSRREDDVGITKVTSDCHSESNKAEEIDSPTSTLKVKESSYSTAARRAYSSSTVPTVTVSKARAHKILSQTATSEGNVSEAVTEVSMSSPHDVRPSLVTAAGRTASSALVLPLVDSTKEPPCDDESGAATVFPIAEVLPLSRVEPDCDDSNTDSDGFTVTDLAVVEDEVGETELTSTMTTIDEEEEVTEAMEEFSTVMSSTEEDGSIEYGGNIGCG